MNFEVTPENNELTEQDLALINRFTRKTLTADDVYTFAVILCDNRVDREYDRFAEETLCKLAPLFDGKTGIFDHSMSSKDQTARIYKTEIYEEPDRRSEWEGSYMGLKGYAYMPRTAGNADLICEIDSGIKKEVSVHVAIRETVCSICGKNKKSGKCTHAKGAYYDGKLCFENLYDPVDAYEWSFVAVPAQPGAGVTKSYRTKEDVSMTDILKTIGSDGGEVTLSSEQAKKLRFEIDSLEKDATLGREYKERLVTETVRYSMAAMPEIGGDVLKNAFSKLDSDELFALQKGFSKLAEKQLPVSLQLSFDEKSETTNNAFKI